ncbi:anti-sigma-F factor Fin [Shouchella shacheensis]|uniref:anti-sigma-F factor Fin n=1 Tax=Shouchella shacheensis TaxID=1649580 RepID=UPI0009EC8C4D|nr:anti-sigma-F factor Fin [Shouchella shacheensis]
MSIYYTCSHCNAHMGTLEEKISETKLGFAQLDPMMQRELLTYKENGDIHVKTICEECHQAFLQNPDLYERGNVIQ